MKTSPLREPSVHVVLVDTRGTILDVRTEAGRADGSDKSILSLYPVGHSYFEHCEDENQAHVQMLLKRKRSLISFVQPSRTPKQKQWFVVIGVPVSAEIGSGAVLMHVDIAPWIAEGKGSDEPAKGKASVALNPSLIQDTIAKALFTQFGPGFGEAPTQPAIPSEVDTLSPRQREVLMLLGAGKSNAEIADELSCSLNTVKRHVTAVLQKLRLPNRTRAATLANRLNYTQGEE